ncbi:MAG: RNase adaptor protein RapZ [Gallionellales bacterium GWA2_55_18]|nr:MAG: RNase adaptor protein RapZ [Gallionellales bacterium GWA2_55_18]
MQLFLISGLSGSGKSVALNMLEDSGYYCVDNLPADLLDTLVQHLRHAGYSNIAVSIDVRSANSVQRLPSLLQQIKRQEVDVHVLFLDAQTETLVKRFSETRRLHPLNEAAFLENGKQERTLLECVRLERELLAAISDIGHHIDTTELNANALRTWIKQFTKVDRARLTLLFQSFGFKRGIPLDADLVFDVRCLPNPHYSPELRPLTGRDTAVSEFLEKSSDAQDMFGDIRDFLERWLPCLVADNRSYLTVAIGCTGGQHRSVYLAEKLARHFGPQQQVLVRHRELA